MSFGWSAGDIVAAISLVTKIVKSVRNVGGAREHFQELESELEGLSIALQEISSLANEPNQMPEIVALKYAACLCEETLKRFYDRISPFDDSLGHESHMKKSKAVPRMVRWELLIKKDIPELRSYLVAHVGSLNLRLNAALLKVSARSSANVTEGQVAANKSSDALQAQLKSDTQTICDKINSLTLGDSAPKLDSLLSIAANVWKGQNEILSIFSTITVKVPPPDISHTWAQAPIKFEDALGRIFPIPSEYDWDKVQAVIEAQFKHGPGRSKVHSGEYELRMTQNNIDVGLIKWSNASFWPGMSITMSFIIGQYVGSERCARLGCLSRSFITHESLKICAQCQSRFRKSRASLPKPLKPPGLGDLSTAGLMHDGLTQNSRNERRTFKNISIYMTDLPATPKVFRDKYHRAREAPPPPVGRKVTQKAYFPVRPQTNQLTSIPRVYTSQRPETLGGIEYKYSPTIEKSSTTSRTGDSNNLPLSEIERIGAEAACTWLDRDFKEEFEAIEQWFRVLSGAERTSTVYALLQSLTGDQIRFFSAVLENQSGI